MNHAINIVLSAILFLGGLVFAFVSFIDGFAATLMAAAGIPPNIQLVILIIVAIMIIAFAIRALGGLFAALLVILLILLVLHQAFPGFHPPNLSLPIAGSVAT